MSASGEADERFPISIYISCDGQVSFQSLHHGDEEQSVSFQETLETSTNDEETNDLVRLEDSESGQTETFVNIDINSDVLEGYMEMVVSYKCTECAYVSDDQKEFHMHCLKHLLKQNIPSPAAETTTVMYLCGGCSQTFSSYIDMKQHMLQDHRSDKPKGDNNVKTINVSIEKSGLEAIKIKKKRGGEMHLNLDLPSSANLTHSCSKKYCTCKFSSEQSLKMHEKCHIELNMEVEQKTYKKLFQCFNCNILFNDWQTCSSHLYKCHDIDCDLLKCPVCETYRTPLPLRLENHMRIHSDVRAFTCKQCGKTFKQASQLRNHKVSHDAKDSSTKPNWSTSKQCNICFKMYSDSKTLKKHKEEVHSKLRPFVCNVCGHASARRSMLKLHQRQHTGLKPFQCNMCNYTTADHNSLRRHIMRHTGVRPYKCPYCPYTAIQSGSYKNHVKTVHSNSTGGLYACNMCLYKTISEDNHVRHISDHLTGLIRDQGASEVRATTTDRSSGLFTVECTDEPGPAGAVQEDDLVVDTGGITIPADPHTAETT